MAPTIPKTIGVKNLKIKKVGNHFKASMALFVPQIAIQVYLLLDRTLLGIITDNVQVGYYENSQKIVKIILTIATAIGTVMMPKIANTVACGNMEKVKYYVKNSFFFVSALSIPLMFGLMAVSKEFSPWFFANKFTGIDSLLIIGAVIILAISWSNVLGMQLLVPLNRTKEFTIS
ncbi:oligosaccharide flippase family protein, partial [Clostridium saudiense]|nr:oligosaccharide flippase family protein [Clostridium saudiense]